MSTSSFGLLDGQGSWAVRCLENQYVALYYDNATKLQTASGGVTVTGAVAATTFSGDLNGTINTATTAATQSAGNNSTKVATTAYADAAVAALIDNAPANLNTLNELAEALNDDDDAIVTINTALGTKLPLAGGTLTGDLTIDKATPRLDFMSNQSGTNVGGRLELNENGNFWLNAQGGKDLWLNWYSPNSPSSKADLAVGDGNSGSAILFVDGSARKVGINNTTPSEALNVTGNILSSGTITGTTLTGTSLDINGNADIAGNITSVVALTADQINLKDAGDYLTFYGDDGAQHSIASRQLQGGVGDDLRFNTYGSYIINLDSNNNQSSAANSSFYITKHGGADGNASGNVLFDIDGENGDATFTGNLDGVATLTATTLDINGNADISGDLTGVDTLTAQDFVGTGSYHEFGNATGSVSNNGGWHGRLNVAGTSHARLDVKSVSDSIITTMFAHTGQGAGKLGTYSNHPVHLVVNGTSRATLDSSANFAVAGELEGGSLDINGNGDISGNLVVGGSAHWDLSAGEYSGDPRALVTGYSGSQYGQIGYNVAFNSDGTHQRAFNDIPTRMTFHNGIVLYAGAAGSAGSTISWTEILEAQTDAFQYKGQDIYHTGNNSAILNSNVTSVSGSSGSCTGNAVGLSSIIATDKIPEYILNKHIYQSGSGGFYMPMVKGGILTGGASTVTGRLRIKIPHYKAASMQSFIIDIYEYNTERMQSIHVGGYSYNDTNASWYNTSAIALMDSDNRDLSVRFGADTSASAQYIAVGEVNTTWTYPQVVVRNYMAGHSTQSGEMLNSFTLEFVTTDGATYNATHDNNQPMANWISIEGKPSTFAPIIGTTSTTAKAGNTTTITTSQAQAITNNTAKTSNVTHTGEVTGSGSLTISDNVVDEANLKISNAATNGYFLSAQSGNTGGLTWAAIPTLNQSTTGNAATATNSTQLNGFTLARIDHAEDFHTFTGINASATQAKRYHIGRLYGCPAHWDGNWQNMDINVTAESYESGHLRYRLMGDYGGAGSQANMMDLYLKEASGPMVPRFRFVLGTPVDAGWDHSGQDTFYVDLYAEAAHYSQWEINIKTYGHGTQSTNPTSGGATTVLYDSPTVSNVSTFSEGHTAIHHLGDEIYHEGHKPTLSELGYTGATDANNYSLPLGTSSARGGFKIGYSESGKNYPVELSSEKMYVNVPWTDNNTVYTHPTFNGDDFSVDTGALTGAVVVSDIDINVTTDTNGHVTDANGSVSTRTLTLANLGYTGATNANNFTYTHPTTAGNKHVPTGGAAGQFLKYSSSGTAVWATPSYIANTDTVYTHPTNLAGDDIDIDTGALTGATVISDLDFNITTNTAGHVTDANATVSTRNLTLANLGYSVPTTVSGSSGSCTGNAATATAAGTVTVTANSQDGSFYPTFVDGTSGYEDLKVDTGWSFNPSSNTMSVDRVTTATSTIRENNSNRAEGGVTGLPLMSLNGQGAGNAANISLHLAGDSTSSNVVKMRMTAVNGDDDLVGAGHLSYLATSDTFGIGQSTSHNQMAILIDNSDVVSMKNQTTFTNGIDVTSAVQSTSKTTGTVKIAGGLGVVKTLNVGEDVVAYASSDERYKDNLKPITNPIDKVKSLTGYTFTWNDKHEQFNGNDDIGVVAQEVEKVLPEIVDTRDNGYKAVKYEKMVALLIEAVKEQQTQIDGLKTIIDGYSK